MEPRGQQGTRLSLPRRLRPCDAQDAQDGEKHPVEAGTGDLAQRRRPDIGVLRGDLIFIFNFNPTKSFTDYGFLVPTGSYDVVLNTDAKEFGGNGLADDTMTHLTNYDPAYVTEHKEWLKLYVPARSAVVLKKN